MATMARPTYPGRSVDRRRLRLRVTFGPASGDRVGRMVEPRSRITGDGEFPMRAVVVYESMFGNTRQVADAVGAGLRAGFDVSVMRVTQADPAQVKEADLIVVG